MRNASNITQSDAASSSQFTVAHSTTFFSICLSSISSSIRTPTWRSAAATPAPSKWSLTANHCTMRSARPWPCTSPATRATAKSITKTPARAPIV